MAFLKERLSEEEPRGPFYTLVLSTTAACIGVSIKLCEEEPRGPFYTPFLSSQKRLRVKVRLSGCVRRSREGRVFTHFLFLSKTSACIGGARRSRKGPFTHQFLSQTAECKGASIRKKTDSSFRSCRRPGRLVQKKRLSGGESTKKPSGPSAAA